MVLDKKKVAKVFLVMPQVVKDISKGTTVNLFSGNLNLYLPKFPKVADEIKFGKNLQVKKRFFISFFVI